MHVVHHFLRRVKKPLRNGLVEELADVLKRPLTVKHHPLGSDEPQPD